MVLAKTDNPKYRKDTATGAVVASDHNEWVEYKRRRDQGREVIALRVELDLLAEEVRNLRKEIEKNAKQDLTS